MGNTTSCCVSSSPKLRRNAHSRLESYRPDTDLSREDTGCNLQHISDRENIDGECGPPSPLPFPGASAAHPASGRPGCTCLLSRSRRPLHNGGFTRAAEAPRAPQPPGVPLASYPQVSGRGNFAGPRQPARRAGGGCVRVGREVTGAGPRP